MARRRHDEEDNPERWLVSYADFITLLFAFFVVMYAISSVNEGKYRVLTQTLTDAFQDQGRVDRGTPVGVEPGGALIEQPEALPSVDPVLVEMPQQGPSVKPDEVAQEPAQEPPRALPDQPEAGGAEQLLELGNRLREVLGDLLEQNLASIEITKDWIELNLDSQLLFETGAARLNRPALRALRDVSTVLKDAPNPINVEGHTDNVPIRTREFPSNWELSAARAASVVHFLARLGIAPQRLSAVGFGEHRPKGDNALAEGRAENRRVTLLILSAQKAGSARGSVRVLSEQEVL